MSSRTPPRILCPHCHAPIDPRQLDHADGMKWAGHICPECDGVIALARTHAGINGAAMTEPTP